MRILHTSDWHLGRSFHRVGMLDAQARYVDHLVATVRAERIDLVVVAGDVYDRALPGVDVVALLDDALARLADTAAAVLLTSGNHDSARRLGFGARLIARSGVHVRTDPARCAEPVLLEDEHGPVAVYGLPYLEPAVVADGLGVQRSHSAVLGRTLDAVRADLAGRGGARSVLAAHAFVVGGEGSDSERDISVGGVASVPARIFDGIGYVALGHLHRPQQLSETVRYSGSPLAYSFSEAGQTKLSWLVELGPDGVTSVEPVPVPVPRPLAVLSGELEGLLADPALAHAEGAWCQVTLSDAERPRDAMRRLRSRFPHTVELRFAPAGALVTSRAGGYAAKLRDRTDLDVCCDFLAHVRGRTAAEPELKLLRRAWDDVRRVEPEELGAAAARADDLFAGPDRDTLFDLPEIDLPEIDQRRLEAAG